MGEKQERSCTSRPEQISEYNSAWATGAKYIVVKTGYLGQWGNYIIAMAMSTRRAEDIFRRSGFVCSVVHEVTGRIPPTVKFLSSINMYSLFFTPAPPFLKKIFALDFLYEHDFGSFLPTCPCAKKLSSKNHLPSLMLPSQHSYKH